MAAIWATGWAFPERGRSQSESPAQTPPETVRKWIADLGSHSYATRRTATRRLTAAGVPVMRAVSNAAVSSDPEVAYRVRTILTRIAKRDGASVVVLLEMERTGSQCVASTARSILEVTAVQAHYKLFMQEMVTRSQAKLSQAMRDLNRGRSDSAWRQVRQVQTLNKRYKLFGQPNPILVVLACLEVETPDESVRVNGIQNRDDKVQALLTQARVEFTDGRIAEARRFVAVANRIGSSILRNPDQRLLIAEIQSLTLLHSARADIAAGRIDAAREKVRQVEKSDRQYGLFLKSVNPETRALLILFKANQSEDDDLRVLTAKPRELADALLKLARADLKSDQLYEARRKAVSAQSLKVTGRAASVVKDIDAAFKFEKRRTVAERLLEIGEEFTTDGNIAQAKNWLAHVAKVYPKTESAAKAGHLLKLLPSE